MARIPPAGAIQNAQVREAPRFICFLCKRKFKSADLLTKHKQLSELHIRNQQKQDLELSQMKEERRQAIAHVRRQIQDVETSMANGKKADEEAKMEQRTSLELKLRQVLGEYGQVQEKLEASRHQQLVERSPGPVLVKRSEERNTRIGKLAISAGASSWQGNKEVQEDRFSIDMEFAGPGDERIVGFLVLDGHSGSLCVDHVLESLHRDLQKCISAKPALTEDLLRQAVTEACVLTEDSFLAIAREREVLDGTTMILALLYPATSSRGYTRVLLANLGDSRAVLCKSGRRDEGRLSAVRLTDDQKPGRADERRRIESKGGVVDVQGVWRVFTPSPASFAGRNLLWGLAVSRAFGDILMKEPQRYGCQGATGELVSSVPEIHTYELQPTEDRFLIVACDGIWDVLGDDDAIAVCMEHRSADLAAHALVRRAFEIGSDDNLTAVVIAWTTEDADDRHDNKRSRAAD